MIMITRRGLDKKIYQRWANDFLVRFDLSKFWELGLRWDKQELKITLDFFDWLDRPEITLKTETIKTEPNVEQAKLSEAARLCIRLIVSFIIVMVWEIITMSRFVKHTRNYYLLRHEKSVAQFMESFRRSRFSPGAFFKSMRPYYLLQKSEPFSARGLLAVHRSPRRSNSCDDVDCVLSVHDIGVRPGH